MTQRCRACVRRHSPCPHPTVCEHIHGGRSLGRWGTGRDGHKRTPPTHPQSSRLTDVPTPSTPMQRTPQSLTLSEGPPWPFSWQNQPCPCPLGAAAPPWWCWEECPLPWVEDPTAGCCFQGQNVRPDSHPRAPGQAGALGSQALPTVPPVPVQIPASSRVPQEPLE